jgi:hypothetical protein
MKTDPLSGVVSLALAIMSGAVLNHWAGLDERIELARATASRSTPTAAPVAPPPAPAAADAPTLRSAPAVLPVATAVPAVEQKLLELVERMHGEQQNLRDQVEEANRDLMELQFRLDMQSESFRPLRTTPQEPSSVPDGPGVLPPLESP